MKFHFRLSVFAAFLLIISACKKDAGSAPTNVTLPVFNQDSINVTTFGASTVKGVGGFSFQQNLKNNLQQVYQNKTVTVTTNGVSGETTTQGLKRYSKAINGRTGFLIIMIGLNDAVFISKNLMTIEETESNMRYYIAQAQSHHLIPIIGTLQYINSTDNEKLIAANSNIDAINKIYKQIGVDNKVSVADINTGLGRDFSLYQDLYHPNEKGYLVITQILFNSINELIKNPVVKGHKTFF